MTAGAQAAKAAAVLGARPSTAPCAVVRGAGRGKQRESRARPRHHNDDARMTRCCCNARCCRKRPFWPCRRSEQSESASARAMQRADAEAAAAAVGRGENGGGDGRGSGGMRGPLRGAALFPSCEEPHDRRRSLPLGMSCILNGKRRQAAQTALLQEMESGG